MVPHAIDWIAEAGKRPVVDIGQIPDDQRRKLDRLAKRGDLVKWRGCWNSGSPDYGIGPLKTWFVSAALVDAAECAVAALSRRPKARRSFSPSQLELAL